MRSKAIQEVIGQPPSWLHRYGITAVLVAFLALFAVGYFLEVPETVTASIQLETSNPPIDVAAPLMGKISHAAPENTEVEKSQILAHLNDNTGNLETILALSEELSAFTPKNKRLPNLTEYEIGDIGSLKKDLYEYLQLFRGDGINTSLYVNQAIGTYNQNIEALKEEIANSKRIITEKEALIDKIPERREELKKVYEKTRNPDDIAPIQQLNTEYNRLIDDIKLQEGLIIQKKREIQNQELEKTKVQNDVRGNQNSRQKQLELTLLNLKTEVEIWKSQHLIVAPESGTLVYQGKLKAKETLVEKGDKIFSIIPSGARDSIEGKLWVNSEASVKIEVGKPVKIAFSAYKPAEYGLIEGVVVNKATLPKNGQYLVTVALPNQMQTSKKKTIPFEHKMLGEAQIITNDRRFTGLIFEQFWEMLER
ncbi:MAG: HlyD family efflux transporter periplasmic adaptor subunit [Bacteroidota bacterium]